MSNALKVFSSLGAGSSWTPADITTELWLDAADSATITIATGVSQWDDKSGNGYNISQGDTTKQPALVSAAQNGQDIIRFNGTDEYLNNDTDTALLQGVDSAMIFAAYKNTDTSVYRKIINLSTVLEATNRYELLCGATANKAGLSGRRTDGGSPTTVASTANAPTGFFIHAAVLDFTNADTLQYINGALDGSNTASWGGGASSSSNTASSRVRVGASIAATPAQYFVGDVCEIIIVHSDITDATRILIEDYLSAKWGISI